MKYTSSKSIASALALGLAITPAMAANPNYAPGDLVLFLQKAGSTKTVYADLGSAATVFRGAAAGPDRPNKIEFLDISAALTTAFGADWASSANKPSLYAGLAAVASTSPTSSTLTAGDPPRTLYVSKSRTGVGTIGAANSAPWTILGDTTMSQGANGIYAQNNKLATLYSDAVAVALDSDSAIRDANPFTAPGIQAPAFQQAFDGGVQQVGGATSFGTFGAAGTVEFALDLYRILAKTGVTGQVAGVARQGSYEGTVTINSSGKVSFIAHPNYSVGDLVLFFQKAGSTNTVYADLGNAATAFRGSAAGPDAPNKVNFLDVSDALTTAFGSGWANDTSVYAGLAAVASTSPTSSTLQNGDPPRTLYVSKPRTAVGIVGTANSAQWTILGDTTMSQEANGIYAQNNKLATLYTDSSITVSLPSDSAIRDANPFTAPGIQAPAFQQAFDGGVQQVGIAGSFGTFGDAGPVKFALDLYRILAKTGVVGQVGGDLRKGSFEGTVTVNSSGQLSYIAQGTPFDNWMRGFPTITDPALKVPGADPDGDGANNLEEFAFGGDPGNGTDQGIRLVQTVDANNDSQGDLTLTLEVRSGATFTPSGTQLTATADGITYTIQGSLDLVDWSSQISEVTPALGSGSPKSGYVFKTFRLVAGNGLTGKGFIRGVVNN